MKHRKAIILVSALAVALSVAWIALAGGDDKFSRPTLRGLNGVYVMVEGINENAKALGLTEEAIQTTVELRLRTLGIKVLTPAEFLAAPGTPFLYVNTMVTTIAEAPLAAVNISLQLCQQVRLLRDIKIEIVTKTWEKRINSLTGVSVVRKSAGESLLSLVDEFANAYLAENPRSPTTQPSAPQQSP